jgi:PAS domain-containing protein
MRSVCAWCNADKGSVDGVDDGLLSHGICRACRARFTPRARPVELRDFLDRLGAPVLVVRKDGRILASNARARLLLGRRLREVEEVPCGVAIECQNAATAAGCGAHARCEACQLRGAILDTWNTARSHDAVPIYARRQDLEGAGELRFLSSTEKVGALVVLRLHAP